MDKNGIDPALERVLDEKLFPASAGDAGLLARVKARVMSAVEAESRPGFKTVRKDSTGWVSIAPGVERKLLWTGGGAASSIVRLLPGARVAAHEHVMDEECVVLEGTLRIGELLLQPGDFHVGRQGTLHEEATTDTGAVVYLRGAQEAAAS